jgi:hypothetical protein
MSHFVCGEILFRGNDLAIDAEYEACLFRLIEAGAKQRLYLQFGHNIVQKIVFEIIGSQDDEIELNRLPFLVVDSPIANTSDELFFPSSSTFSPYERISNLKSRFGGLISWVNFAFGEQSVAGMCIWLSEGYDTNYDQKECSVRDFPTVVYDVLLQEEVVPSTKIIIRA